MSELQRVNAAAEFLCARLPQTPELALVLGSGLGGLADRIEEPVYIPYAEVPAFRFPPPRGTPGVFVAGRLNGRSVFVHAGAFPLLRRARDARHRAAGARFQGAGLPRADFDKRCGRRQL